MAPEVLLNQPYEGEKFDVFAAGVTLFCMVNKHPPFIIAQPSDSVYRCIAAGRFDLFWKIHSKNKAEGLSHFSEEFKNLIE